MCVCVFWWGGPGSWVKKKKTLPPFTYGVPTWCTYIHINPKKALKNDYKHTLFTKSLLHVLYEMRQKVTDQMGLRKVFSIQDTENGTDDENHKSKESKTYLIWIYWKKGFSCHYLGSVTDSGERGMEMIYTGKRGRYVYSKWKMLPQKAGNTIGIFV